MDILLVRHIYKKNVTLGAMFDAATGHFICCTLEEPNKNNKRQISCIPEGIYTCKPHTGTKFKNVWEVTDVPNRVAILLHAGNTTLDIEGCVLVGMEHGTLKGLDAVLRSKEALLKLRMYNAGKTFNLTITSIKRKITYE